MYLFICTLYNGIYIYNKVLLKQISIEGNPELWLAFIWSVPSLQFWAGAWHALTRVGSDLAFFCFCWFTALMRLVILQEGLFQLGRLAAHQSLLSRSCQQKSESTRGLPAVSCYPIHLTPLERYTLVRHWGTMAKVCEEALPLHASLQNWLEDDTHELLKLVSNDFWEIPPPFWFFKCWFISWFDFCDFIPELPY